jgi:predicted transcriptional regulator YdeE
MTSYALRDEERLTIVGISDRVSNAEAQKIGDLWRRFHVMGGGSAIPTRLSNAVYGVYCEYDGDYTQPFTALIGCAVAPDAAVPEGMRRITVEAGRFAVYRPVGEMPQAVFQTWAEIWETPLERRYEADYDRYGDRYGADGLVEIHVGVR